MVSKGTLAVREWTHPLKEPFGVTGVGCSASALVGSLRGGSARPRQATLAAIAVLGVVGEKAVARIQAAGAGVGRLQTELLDGLQFIDEASFYARLKMIVHE